MDALAQRERGVMGWVRGGRCAEAPQRSGRCPRGARDEPQWSPIGRAGSRKSGRPAIPSLPMCVLVQSG
eukprot:270995-Pyramimonas_sp.AAC.1